MYPIDREEPFEDSARRMRVAAYFQMVLAGQPEWAR